MAQTQKEASRKWYLKKRKDPAWRAQHAARYKAWAAANPEGNRERNRKRRAAKPDRYAIYEIRKNYKVTLQEAERLYNLRKAGCSICGSKTRPMIDHDHESGMVRGILCGHCNLALGHAQEDPERLEELARYIRRHQ